MIETQDLTRQMMQREIESLRQQLEKTNKYADHLGMSLRDVKLERDELKAKLQEPERHALQLEGKHSAPCAKFCEANAFLITERNLKRQLAAVTAERDELVAALEKASNLIDKHLKWDRRIDDDMDFIDAALAKLGADKTGEE